MAHAQDDRAVESLFLENLPVYVEEKIASNQDAVKRLIRRHKEKAPEQEYMLFSHVPSAWIDSNADYSRVFGKNGRIFFHAGLRKLILKISTNAHEVGTAQFSRSLDFLTWGMGLRRALFFLSASTVKNGDYGKEPDGSWRPASLPNDRDSKWPSVTLETGYSEGLSRLRADASWWLCSSKGEVKLVIIMAVNARHPHIVIETWESGSPTAGAPTTRSTTRAAPTRRQEISISRDADGTVIAIGGPLTLLFSAFFLRSPMNAQETDFIFSQQEFEDIADAVWQVQGF